MSFFAPVWGMEWEDEPVPAFVYDRLTTFWLEDSKRRRKNMDHEATLNVFAKRWQDKFGAINPAIIDPAIIALIMSVVMAIMQQCMKPDPPTPTELKGRAAHPSSYTLAKMCNGIRQATGWGFIKAMRAAQCACATLAEASDDEAIQLMAACSDE